MCLHWFGAAIAIHSIDWVRVDSHIHTSHTIRYVVYTVHGIRCEYGRFCPHPALPFAVYLSRHKITHEVATKRIYILIKNLSETADDTLRSLTFPIASSLVFRFISRCNTLQSEKKERTAPRTIVKCKRKNKIKWILPWKFDFLQASDTYPISQSSCQDLHDDNDEYEWMHMYMHCHNAVTKVASAHFKLKAKSRYWVPIQKYSTTVLLTEKVCICALRTAQ